MSLDVFLANLDPMAVVEIRATGPDTADAFFQERAQCSELPDKLAITRLGSARPARHYFVHQISQGRIFVDLDRARVYKQIVSFVEFDLAGREAGWLDRLADAALIPDLLSVDGQLLVTEYRGEPLRHHNLPDDWQNQAETILAALDHAGCAHNDIKCDNLVVADGRLSLIDFGWATAIGDPIPADWPAGLGRQHRLGIHRFDDRHAIFEACRSALENRVDLSRRVH